MSLEAAPAQKEPSGQSFRLVPSGLDFSTLKTHLIVAVVTCLLLTAAIFHIQPTINWLVAALCAVLVSQITAEITGLYGNRLGGASAIWSGLLFCLYPMHTSTIAATVWPGALLAGFFYLAAIHFYFKFRAWHERPYLFLSLSCCFLALLCDTVAWTIPLVITAAEVLILPAPAGLTETSKIKLKTQRLMSIMLYWFLLIFAFSTLQIAVGTGLIAPVLVPLASVGIDLKESILWLAASNSMATILLPPNPDNTLAIAATVAYVAITILLTGRIFCRAINSKVLLFLALWFVAALLTISNKAPAPPGLFLASGPLSMFLTLSALPDLTPINKKVALTLCTAAVICLALLAGSWAGMLIEQSTKAAPPVMTEPLK